MKALVDGVITDTEYQGLKKMMKIFRILNNILKKKLILFRIIEERGNGYGNETISRGKNYGNKSKRNANIKTEIFKCINSNSNFL